jgi:hypothetical protein
MGEFVHKPSHVFDLAAAVDRDRKATLRGRLAFAVSLDRIRFFFIEPLGYGTIVLK